MDNKTSKIGICIFLIGSVFSAIGLVLTLRKISSNVGETTPEIIDRYGLLLLIIGVGILAIGLKIWWPHVSKILRKILGVIAGGVMISVISVFVLNLIFGACFYPGCNTQIEFLLFDSPDEIYHGFVPKAHVIIKNSGDEIAENCVLDWGYTSVGGGHKSSTFSLKPDETKEFYLEGTVGVDVVNRATPEWEIYCETASSYDGGSSVVVRCNNADTGKLSNPLKIKCHEP